jgi:TonB family protein
MRYLQQISFWLALLIHLCIFLGISLVFWPLEKPIAAIETSIPAYAYEETTTPTKPIPKPKILKEIQKEEISPYAIKKAEVQPSEPQPLTQPVPKTRGREGEPIHLLGEKGVPQPLIVLLGKALTAHLAYPKIAVDWRVHGVTVIRFLVSPDGEVTNVQLLKTSHAEVLDNAALVAAKAISPVKNVDLYLKEPKYIVFGIIFGERE